MSLYARSIIAGMLLALLFTSLFGCGNTESDTSQPVYVAEPIPVEIPQPSPQPECTNRDLAGTCFNNPPTLGALQIQ